jgi:diguanylate cyclase (GGDEF)-like protein
MAHLGIALRTSVARLRDTAEAVAGWDVWNQAAGWLAFAIVCELAAVVLTIVDASLFPPRGMDFSWLAVLVVLGVVQAELSSRIERVRRWMSGETHINMTSVWYLAGTVLLSPAMVSLLAVILYAHLWIRVWRHVRARPAHRVAVSTAWALLPCFAAAAVLRATGLGGLDDGSPAPLRAALIMLVAAVVFESVNAALAATGIFLYTRKRSVRALLGTWSDNALESVTLCLGALAALALVYQPVFVVLVLPPLLMLHRSVLVKQLEVAASTDDKTGLLNALAWHDSAQSEYARSLRDNRTFGVLMADLDYFKRVNDTYGHVAGDVVLKAVADVLRAQVRDYDLVGRFGGEEFAILLPGIAEHAAVAVGERIRLAVERMAVEVALDGTEVTIGGLSVSIGIAVHPMAGDNLEKLLLAADTALYKAKNAGRNRVVSSTQATQTTDRTQPT